jgi:predicted solute-binding protein
MKSRLAVSDALYLQPLLCGLETADAHFELVRDSPARIALKFSERAERIRCAFLSPIDYARHAGEYRIIPGICAASSQPTGTICLQVNPGVRNILTVAVDVRVTSEILLAKIILLERYRSALTTQALRFLAVQDDPLLHLHEADAALQISLFTKYKAAPAGYVLDLVEEWQDMTGLPYVHGFWVGGENEVSPEEVKTLARAKTDGVRLRDQIADHFASLHQLPIRETREYLSSFSYELGEQEEEGISEFIRYAYFHGALGDIPDLQYFESPSSALPLN